MPKLVDPEGQRRDIRRAALRVFARKGVKGVGLAHVARAAGVGRSSLYHYYADKAALVRDVTLDLLREEEARFAAAVVGTGTPLERIEALVADLGAMFGAWQAVGQMFFDLRSLDRPLFAGFFRRARAHLATVVADGQARGELDPEIVPETAAATIIGAIDGLLLQALVDARAFPDPAALERELLRIVRKVVLP